MILYIENPKVSTQKLLELINEFSKFADTRLIYRNQFLFYILIIKYQKEKVKNNPSYNGIKNNKNLGINLPK